MKVTYEKNQRERVKITGERLFCIQITGKSGKGGITMAGPVSEDEAKKIHEFLSGMIKTREADKEETPNR